MALNQNQIREIVVQGMMDPKMPGASIPCQLYSGEAGTLVPGQAVKIYDIADGVIKVVAAAADTDNIFGCISYAQKDSGYVAGDACEVSVLGGGGYMWMTVSAAVARGAAVMAVISGSKVATATTNKRIIGIAIDKASTNGDLIRVLMLSPGPLAA